MNDKPGSLRRIADGVADNRIARGYLALCAALLLWVAFDSTLVHHEDASFAGVWPVLLTFPTGSAVLALPDEGTVAVASYYALVPAAAVLNAWLFSALLRRLRGRAVRA
ncbi:SCO4225 family membrane protein [Streptomyces megasporus]|uniref:SCO4225 family membrane protein n=1 Tax=Streptomyces megasporus TaxID=44060 RepID=UPI000690990B|nr:hypothetical protein [Streptomyces megasporus]